MARFGSERVFVAALRTTLSEWAWGFGWGWGCVDLLRIYIFFVFGLYVGVERRLRRGCSQLHSILKTTLSTNEAKLAVYLNESGNIGYGMATGTT